MKRSFVNMQKILVIFIVVMLMAFASTSNAFAQATDEITNFTITVDVNDDASLDMTYHIDWKVLDDSIGELEWIDLGVPNSHHYNITPLTDTIDYINDEGSSLEIYLDRPYGENETVSLEFSMTQDYMYQIDKYAEGETVYTFTPAWFDGMDVDDLTIRWNAENAIEWQPGCYEEDGYLVFNTSLSSGGRYTMSVTYPNDAFGFTSDHQEGEGDGDGWDGGGDWDYNSGFDLGSIILGIFGLIFSFLFFVAPFILLFKFIKWIAGGAGFGSNQPTKKKIVRTKIVYYDNCPSCGMAREEGKDSCQYCGRSMIKSKEVVEEKEIKDPEKYTKKGTYRYGDSPNTYIHVNVISVPVRTSGSSGSRRSGGGGSSHHSSCACASSGRAGCSVKDFFKEKIHEGRVRIESKDRTDLDN
ncbi:MAG: hypothetical protein IKX81_01905 [Firmicutes bacterium]|nr:hypothetical protein [Bacillota bacterium]